MKRKYQIFAAFDRHSAHTVRTPMPRLQSFVCLCLVCCVVYVGFITHCMRVGSARTRTRTRTNARTRAHTHTEQTSNGCQHKEAKHNSRMLMLVSVPYW